MIMIECRLDEIIMEAGSYSYNDSKNKMYREFDVVTKDRKGYIAYECKYTNSPIDKHIIEEELNQANDLIDIAFYKLGFISKSGYKADVDTKKYICFSLDNFYK